MRSVSTKSETQFEVPEPILLTPEGFERLGLALEHLRSVRLPRLVSWVQEVMEDGFDDDATEYELASLELSMVRQRIQQLETVLTSAQVLEDAQVTDLVRLGSRITVADGNSVETYRLVSQAEADPSDGRISPQSPLGRALLGRSVGDQVLVQAPDGPIQWRILSIA